MKRMLSPTILAISCLGAATLAYMAITRLHFAICEDGEGWTVFGFCVIYGPVLAACMLLLGVVPAAILYRKGRNRRDLISLCISGITLALIVAAWFLLDPLRRWIIFKGK
jgi:hypothetical protein